MYDSNTIMGERMKALREEQEISQEYLAIALNVTRQTIGYYENGKYMPDARMLKAIANHFNCTTDYLLGLTEHRNEAVRSRYDRMTDFCADKLEDLDYDTRVNLTNAIANLVDTETRLVGYRPDEPNNYKYAYTRSLSDIIWAYIDLMQSLTATQKYLTEKQDIYTKTPDGTFDLVTHTAGYFFRLKEDADKIKKMNEDLINSVFSVTLHGFDIGANKNNDDRR